jgi:6-pyruvoyltetrahydropterin/6-carboxytetrahydropterin synthase
VLRQVQQPRRARHNYVFEPCVAVAVEPRGRSAFTHDDLETIASRVLVDRFDHKNLNLDTAEFRDGAGVMPSVENIAKVSFELLAPEIARSAPGARLVSITVWETDRTCCTYPG